MDLIWSILIGFVVGLFARALMPGQDSMGFIITTLLGIGGALIGQFLGQAIGIYHEGQRAGFFMSLLGALVLLFLYNQFIRKRSLPPSGPPQ